MGVESVISWIAVRRFDQLDSSSDDVSESPPLPLELQRDSSFTDLRCRVRAWLGLPEDGGVVMKLRSSDGTLLPLSCLLAGNSDAEPFILDIARIHQTTPASVRSALPPAYIETVRSKLRCLERRVERVESLIPELRSRHQASVEHVLHQLGSKVHFLDKRLDELVPSEWKGHLQ
ncbi:uncharacterized protein LOC111875280 [Cryptotermes secundus]|uniref:uncharacterized protein LOC111875280 n=1 Tax=Cryptotermes secundus TaxID=105785 RepID=UPI000CD7DBD5|nr:uncharacterized protein LOC111875280 [Cryptotermes secundus]